jgi:hypothetical protein
MALDEPLYLVRLPRFLYVYVLTTALVAWRYNGYRSSRYIIV